MIFSTVNEIPLNEAAELLADLIIRMIEDSDLRKNYGNGQKVAEKFDKHNIIELWNKLLKK